MIGGGSMSELVYNNTLEDIPGPFLQYTQKEDTHDRDVDAASASKPKNGLDTRDMFFMMLLMILMSY